MTIDISRAAYDPRKRYASVRMQQGRVLLDDDFNEAEQIDDAAEQRVLADLVGPAGSPDDGFRVGDPRTVGTSLDFDILPGTMYVGGLRIWNPSKVSFAAQPDWLDQPAAVRALPPAGRVDLVYLEAWRQEVTAIEDAELFEAALAGPDTSARTRTMWRVRLEPGVKTNNCAEAWAGVVTGWTKAGLGTLQPDGERTVDTTLTVGFEPGGSSGDLCSPSVVGGYLGAENQAIRVELVDASHFTWGFDNASPLYRVKLGADRVTVTLETDPKDQAHWPIAGQVIELLAWQAVLPNNEKLAATAGHLSKIQGSYNAELRTLTLATAVPAGFGENWTTRSDAATLAPTTADRYFFLRVWNRGDDVTSVPKIPFMPGSAVALGSTGLDVTFRGTQFVPGDHWVIAARPETPDTLVPWSLKTGRAPHDVRRFYAPLGLIHWQAGGAHTVFDCRATFAPLTRLQGCCISVSPRSGWEHILDEHAADDDLCLCFEPGVFTTSRTLVLRNRNVKVHGAGGASRIRGLGIEAVLRFEGCAQVDISDLSVEATATLREGQGAARPHLSGALTTVECDQVAIRGVTARCASGTAKNAACISIYNALPADSSDTQRRRVLASSVRVQGCELITGANQVGLLIVNYGHTTISDNVIHVDPATNATIPSGWLQDRAFRRSFRRALLYRYGLGTQIPNGATSVRLGETPAWIETAPAIATSWQAVINTRKFNPNQIDHMTAGEFLHELADDLVFAGGAIGPKHFPVIERYISDMLALRTKTTAVRTLAAQGIVVAGTAAHDVHITGNLVRDTPQGVHVGTSTRRIRDPGPESPVADSAGRVVIAHNTIQVALMPESAVERHGIFIGNCQSLVIEANHLECEQLGQARRLHIDGIRCYGFLGKMAYITHNDLLGFTTGIRIAPLNNSQDGSSSLWKVVDNIASGSTLVVDRSLKSGATAQVTVTDNRG